MLPDLLYRLRSLFRSRTVEAELDDELSFHRERQLEKYLRSGLPREEALRRVRLDFGGADQIKEECRDARGVSFVETTFQDLRYGLRTLRKSPIFTAVALFTLALGIGANTAIFSVVYGVLLRPLPFADPARLVVLNETTPRVGLVSVSYPNFLDWRAQSRAFSAMAGVYGVSFNMAGISRPENIKGQAVSPNFFDIAGVRPVLGRGFTAAEEKPGAAPVLLLSYPLWQSHFGGDPNVLGGKVTLNSTSYTIVGVLPPGYRWIEQCDVLEPIGVWATKNSEIGERDERGDMVVLGRLGPGATLPQARAEMEGIAARLARAYPEANDQCGVALRPLRDLFVGDIRPAILVLLGAVVLVLLIACANVANLFLMRAAGRTRELALRFAIGAGRGRLVRQLMAESFLVACLGGIAGIALAYGGVIAIVRLIPAAMLNGASVQLNGPVLLFTAAVTFLSMFAFGLAPALHSTGSDVQSQLKDGARASGAGLRQQRWRAILAAAEISLALVLLIGAGLMMKSLSRLLSVDPGFHAPRVLTLNMSLRTDQYQKDAPVLAFWDRLLAGVRALPGVESAALGNNIPLTDSHWRTDIMIEGLPEPLPGSFPHPDIHIVGPGYLGTLSVRLLRGRDFSAADVTESPRIALVNQQLAARFYPGQDPVGKRFLFGRPSQDEERDKKRLTTIVGVVADTRLYGIANPARLEVYLPLTQFPADGMTLLVKCASSPASITSAIRAVAASIDRDQPIYGIATVPELIDADVSTRRLTLALLGLFSTLALALAAIGIYGVISYSVAQRTREIGIRMALGAQSGDVLRLVLAQGAKIAAAGVMIGAAASFFLTRSLTKLLYEVSAADPSTFAAVAIGLALVAMLACYIPARRTLRLDPLAAVRHE